jgi:hypothetical protein
LLLRVVNPLLLVEDRAVVPVVSLIFYIWSGVSLFVIYLLLLHCVKRAEDNVADYVVRAVVAVFRKLLLGHLLPFKKVPPLELK